MQQQSEFFEINKKRNTVTIKEPINKLLERGIRGCCHPVNLSIDEVIDHSYKIFSHTEICNLNTYIQRSRGEILFARKWLMYEGQSEDVILPYFAKILEKDFDESGVNSIIYRNNGSAGSFVKLAKVLSIPWIILADNDKQGKSTADEVRNCGYSEEIINEQVLLTKQQDFENELATSNRIFSDYETIVKDKISKEISNLKTEENIATYKDKIITLVKKRKSI
jgi:putative ATP-dependent endonuclease of OLD family